MTLLHLHLPLDNEPIFINSEVVVYFNANHSGNGSWVRIITNEGFLVKESPTDIIVQMLRG